MRDKTKKLVAVLTNNDDDIYCFRKELIEAIIKNGYDVLISCPYGKKFELMKDVPYIYDDPCIDRRGTNIVADMKLFLHYLFLLIRNKPDVVLTYTAKPNVYCGLAAFILHIPVISNVTGFGSVLNQTGTVQKFIMALFRFAFRRSRCVMFQNETNMKLALESGMVKGECRLIPGSGVNISRYEVLEYPSDENGISFNYIGRILHDKGVDDYIEAAKIIKSKHPYVKFNMLGFIEPTEIRYEKLLAELEQQGIVKYHGSQNDVRPFIGSSHATIHPSTYGEGMSNVLLETASSGRPIISTDNPGCKETFVDGVSGFMYKGGNVSELCEKIEKFLALSNEQRKNMGLAGRKHIEENFSREIVINAYLEKISELVK